MFPDEGRDQGPVGPVDIQKLNPDPTAFEMAADYGPTADPAESGQLEPQAQGLANGVANIQFKEGAAGAENHEASTGSRLASVVIDPHVNVEADLRAWVSPLIGWCRSLRCCQGSPAQSSANSRRWA